MKSVAKYLMVFIFLTCANVYAQKNKSNTKESQGNTIQVDIKLPPKYPDIIIQNLYFENTSTGVVYKNNEKGTLRFEQTGIIKMTLYNKGEGIAKGLMIAVNDNIIKGLKISLPGSGNIGDLEPGKSKEIDITVTAGISVENKDENITLQLTDTKSYTNIKSTLVLKAIGFYTGNEFDLNDPQLTDYYSKYDLADVQRGVMVNYKEDILRDLRDKNSLFMPKDEWETPSDFEKRKEKADKYKKDVLKKYEALFDRKKIEKRADSYHEVNLKIDNISTYDPVAQKFVVDINKKPYELYISNENEEARKFKEDFTAAAVKGIERFKSDFSGYEIINIKVFHPLYTNKYYKVGVQIPVEEDSVLSFFVEEKQGLPNVFFEVKYLGPGNKKEINANETGCILVVLKNKGNGESGNVSVSLKEKNNVDGLKLDETMKSIKKINPGDEDSVRFYLYAGQDLADATYSCDISINESLGFYETGIQNITINTYAFRPPVLKVVSKYFIEDENNVEKPDGAINKGELIHSYFSVSNIGEGTANDVKVSFNTGSADILFMKSKASPVNTVNLGTILPGEAREVVFDFSVTVRYDVEKYGSKLPVKVNISESYGLYGVINASLDLEINKMGEIEMDVDNISGIQGSNVYKNNAYAVIIGNEDYKSSGETSVEYAINDAEIFRNYVIKILGYQEDNTRLFKDLTSVQFDNAIKWLEGKANENPGAELLFYYSGHGAPENKKSFLLPVDVSSGDLSKAYMLDDICDRLHNTNPGKALVITDACFSGANINVGAKASRMKVENTTAKGNVIVLSSSQGDEPSEVYKKRKHGYFTYYLLCKLLDKSGDISVKELMGYVKDNVSKKVEKDHGKTQTPCLIYSPGMESKISEIKLK